MSRCVVESFSHYIFFIIFQAAKAAKYANYQKLCDAIFTVFTVLWIVTRLGIYPFYIIWRYVYPILFSQITGKFSNNGRVIEYLFFYHKEPAVSGWEFISNPPPSVALSTSLLWGGNRERALEFRGAYLTSYKLF